MTLDPLEALDQGEDLSSTDVGQQRDAFRHTFGQFVARDQAMNYAQVTRHTNLLTSLEPRQGGLGDLGGLGKLHATHAQSLARRHNLSTHRCEVFL
jgi:hypothetical protein